MWDIFFYAVIGVGALLFFGLLYYRIDWARHPEKYKDLENDEKMNTGTKSKRTGRCVKRRPRTRLRP